MSYEFEECQSDLRREQKVAGGMDHVVELSIDFGDIDEYVEKECGECGETCRRVREGFAFSFGDRDKITFVAYNTPLVRCNCGTLMDETSYSVLNEVYLRVSRAIRSFDEDVVFELDELVEESDSEKILDYALNRIVPHPDTNEPIPASEARRILLES